MEELKTSKKKSWAERLVMILAYVLIFLGLVFIAFKLSFRLPHTDYYNASVAAFEIPGTNDGFIAQGIDYDPAEEQFLVTGYMKDGSASPLFFVSKEGKATKLLYFSLPNGEVYTGHNSGVSLAGNYVYLSGDRDGCLYLFDYAEMCRAESGAIIPAQSTPLMTAVSEADYVAPSFLYDTEEYLIVGEFYREGDYPTLESHRLTTEAGDYQQALAVVYRRDASQPLGVEPTPVAAVSLPDQVQGMAMTEDRVYLSTSWGLSRSHILTYDAAGAAASRQGEITVLGTTLPLYAFDSACLISDTEIPPMSEELLVLDGRLYVMCEAASDKYIFGKFTDAEFCYATLLDFFEQ